MTEQPVEILLVENDVEVAEMLEQCLVEAGTGQVTRVESAADALREELTTRHDIVIASMMLPDADGLELTRAIRAQNSCPIILMTAPPSADEAIEALRLGVKDVLIKPFDLADAVVIIQHLAEQRVQRVHRRRRYRRLRRISSRIIRERRDLRQRMDLICRDLVQAYRGLAQKVAESGILVEQSQE